MFESVVWTNWSCCVGYFSILPSFQPSNSPTRLCLPPPIFLFSTTYTWYTTLSGAYFFESLAGLSLFGPDGGRGQIGGEEEGVIRDVVRQVASARALPALWDHVCCSQTPSNWRIISD